MTVLHTGLEAGCVVTRRDAVVAEYLLLDPAPVKLRPLLKNPLVLVGFFRREGFAVGAGM